LKVLRNITTPIKRIEVHSGHLHTDLSYETVGGVLIKYIPAICGAGGWDHLHGYVSYKTMLCNVWDDNKGITQTLYSNI